MRFGNKKKFTEKYFNIFDKYPRHYFIFGVFFIAFLIIIKTLFTYTFFDNEFYKTKANSQQILGIKIPITRGSIFSGNEKNIKLASTVNLNDLAIDPTQPGDKKKLILFLTDIIYKESCEGKTAEKCKNKVLKFIKENDFTEGLNLNKNVIKKLIEKKLIEKISEKYITSIIITRDLDEKQIQNILNLNLKGIYIYQKSLYVDPTQISNKETFSAKLSPIISFPVENIIPYLKLREKRYISLLKKLSIESSSEIQEILNNEKNAIKKGYIDKKSAISAFIQLEPNSHRFYPENKAASQVLGFVNKEGKGYYGIEGYFNEILKGEAKEIIIKKDIQGRVINPIDLKKGIIEREGAVIYTTIDRNIQKKVEEIIEEGVKKYNANKGSIVIMNPTNGKIIAMANYPTFGFE
ncbi:MAG: hypothetical protein Q9M97_10380 [Candidatus Gracilibacteria bacterium]|nr:hypothetical protein [Candidatus Gracilibacteria bacterium]